MTVNNISILGCGWLGLPLAKHFVSKGYTVKGSTTTKEKLSVLNNEQILPYSIDLSNNFSNNYKDFLLDSNVIVINIPPKRKTENLETYSEQLKNIIPHINNEQNVIFISSTSVYQNTNNEVTEALNPTPEKISGKAVLIAENYLKQVLGNRLTIIRFAGLVGYDRHPGRFLANRKELPNGDAPVNIIHRDDCINIIYQVIKMNIWGDIINGCADKHPLRKEYYIKAAKNIGLPPPSFTNNKTNSFKIISNTKSKTLLKYSYKYPDPLLLLDIE